MEARGNLSSYFKGFILKPLSSHFKRFKFFFFLMQVLGSSPVVQWLRLCAPNTGGPGLIPSQEAWAL